MSDDLRTYITSKKRSSIHAQIICGGLLVATCAWVMIVNGWAA